VTQSSAANVYRTIGLDLGGTNLRGAVVEIDGQKARIVEQRRCHVGEQRNPEAVARLTEKLIVDLDASGRLAVGVGVAGMLEGTSGVVANAPNLGWRDVNFARLVADRIGRPLWLENDLSAICWGEYRFGAARNMPNVLCVFVGTGVGGGAVLGDCLFRGATNACMEVGHVKVAAGGRRCGCGARGCLEAYAGGTHLAMQAREDPSPKLLELVEGEVERLHAGHLDQASEHGCERSRAILERAGAFLGQTLANAVTLLNCDCLLLGGTVWTNTPRLRKVCLSAFDDLTNAPARHAVEIAEAVLGDDAGVLGAADLGLLQSDGTCGAG
jgi:glucokinase